MTEILTVRNLCKHYPAFELHDVSFSIRASSIMGLIGRNGAGKTTTIKSILRLVRPDGGSVEFLGQPVDDDAAALRREAGYVSGDLCYYPRKRLSQLTAVTRSFYSAWDSARYEALLRRFSLDDSKRVCELSRRHEGQVPACLRPVARGKASDSRRADIGSGPRVERRSSGASAFAVRTRRCVDSVFHAHYERSGRLRRRCDVSAKRCGCGQLPAFGIHRAVEKAHGAEASLSPELKKTLRGLRVHRGEFEGLFPSALACPSGCREEAADLQSVMVFLEREVEER